MKKKNLETGIMKLKISKAFMKWLIEVLEN